MEVKELFAELVKAYKMNSELKIDLRYNDNAEPDEFVLYNKYGGDVIAICKNGEIKLEDELEKEFR